MNWLKMVWNIGNDVQQKGWWASKTVWFNILSFIAALAAIKGLNVSADDITTIAAGVAAVGNIFLRFHSDTPIGSSTVPPEGRD